MDWNLWIAELVEKLGGTSEIHRHMSHIRYAYKQGQSPQEVAEWVVNEKEKVEHQG